MKKGLLVAAAALFILASCKKNYTCSCTKVATASGMSTFEIQKSKKGDAQALCDDAESTYKVTSAEATCDLN